MMERDSARSWALAGMLCAAHSLGFVDRVVLSVATPVMMKELSLTPLVAGVLLSAFFWSYTLVQLPIGLVLVKYGVRWTMAVGFIIWTVSCALTGWVQTFAALVATRVGLGAGEAVIYPGTIHVGGVAFTERRRGLAMAISQEGSKIGPALGAPLAGYLISAYGWREMFLIVGLGALVWLVPWLLIAPSRGQDVAKHREAFGLQECIALLKKRVVWGIMIGHFGVLYVVYVYITWLPGYLVLSRGFTIFQAGMYSALPFVTQGVSALFGGWIGDHFVAKGYPVSVVRKSMIALGLLVALVAVPSAFIDDPGIAMALFAISTIGLGMAVPNMQTIPSTVAPTGYAGLYGAIQGAVGNFGGVVAPVVTGFLYGEYKSFTAVFIGQGIMLCLSALGYLVVIGRIEQQQHVGDAAPVAAR
jgi:MFS transporter, ACS family, D-galactonate transporter